MVNSSILFQNKEKSIILLDLPRSIEEAQVPLEKLGSGTIPGRRLVSAKPPEKPFPTPEPKHAVNILHPSAQVTELMTAAAVSNALEELRTTYSGPWCLPRVYERVATGEPPSTKKRKLVVSSEEKAKTSLANDEGLLPEGSNYLLGSIESKREAFLSQTSTFDLIILDPPWPNRSVRRKKGSYSTAENLDGIRELLSQIPIAARLARDGLVAVWVTNKPSIIELLTSSHGLFAEWGLEVVDEWTWLKVTTSGEPVYGVESQWRKPWERILIVGRPGHARKWTGKSKVVISVPDVHSRKPHLRSLFDDILPPHYTALEVFARNLTAGWWSWGDEVLKFQTHEHWVDCKEKIDE